MSQSPASLLMVVAAVAALGCSGAPDPGASTSETPVASNAKGDLNPFSPGAETPTFWSEAQWKGKPASK